MILQKFGIDINDAFNGVYLPDRLGVGTTEVYHRSLHTEAYYKAVFKELGRAGSADDARDILQSIARKLKNVRFPK